jgi:hypothetical protein
MLNFSLNVSTRLNHQTVEKRTELLFHYGAQTSVGLQSEVAVLKGCTSTIQSHLEGSPQM